jgi:hypothetical protein
LYGKPRSKVKSSAASPEEMDSCHEKSAKFTKTVYKLLITQREMKSEAEK